VRGTSADRREVIWGVVAHGAAVDGPSLAASFSATAQGPFLEKNSTLSRRVALELGELL
jgi:hypothetical protein